MIFLVICSVKRVGGGSIGRQMAESVCGVWCMVVGTRRTATATAIGRSTVDAAVKKVVDCVWVPDATGELPVEIVDVGPESA